jgi:hypothetical protein
VITGDWAATTEDSPGTKTILLGKGEPSGEHRLVEAEDDSLAVAVDVHLRCIWSFRGRS